MGPSDHAPPARTLARASAECAALPAIAQTFGADAVCLYEIDRHLNAGDHRLFNLDPDSIDSYRRHFAKIDPLHPRRATALGGDVVHLADIVTPARLAGSEYYRHFMRRFGMQDEVEIVLRENGRPVAGLSLIRSAGRPAFGEEHLRWARIALPMVRALVRDESRAVEASLVGLMTDAYRLTPRELEIVDMLREGRPNKRIAEHLGISVPTVKSHVHNLLAKLGVRSRAELVAAFFVR